MAIVFLRRFAVAEHYAACHGIRALDVRVVETLYMPREDVEPEITFHLLHQFLHPTLRIEVLGELLLVVHILPDVLHPDIEDLLLVAPLRHDKFRVLELDIRKERHDHRRENPLKPTPHLRHSKGKDLRRSLGKFAPELHVQALHHCSMPEMHEVDVGGIAVFIVGKHIGLGVVGQAYHRLGVVSSQNLIFLLHLLRLLEFPFLGKARHLILQILLHTPPSPH